MTDYIMARMELGHRNGFHMQCTESRADCTFDGEISDMYRGTRAEDSPMPTPTAILPNTIPHNPEAVPERRQPASIGTAAAIRAFLRPNESASPLPVRLPIAAPAKQLDTTYHHRGRPLACNNEVGKV